MVLVCSIPWVCIVKKTINGHVHEGWNVGRSNATPTKLFSIDFYDLKSMSFNFGNDIIIDF